VKTDLTYLEHIRECIRRVEKNTAGGHDAFVADDTLQDAVLRNLQTLSEATQRLSDKLKDAHPQVEWDRIAAFRNVLVHNYLGIDLETVWRVVEEEIPVLKAQVSTMIVESTLQ
jgi:uncharacterized protein with HEPN domain